jgi:hypothetical protein
MMMMIIWIAHQPPRMKNQRHTKPEPLMLFLFHHVLFLRVVQWISLIAIITEQLMRTLEKAGGSDPQVVRVPCNALNASIKRPFPIPKSYLEFSSSNHVFRLCLYAYKPLTTLLTASKAARRKDTQVLPTFQQSFHRCFSSSNIVIIATSTPTTDSTRIVAKRKNTTFAS